MVAYVYFYCDISTYKLDSIFFNGRIGKLKRQSNVDVLDTISDCEISFSMCKYALL